MSDHEHRAAEFASTLTLSACPASVVDEAALLTADTLGAIIGGAPLEPVSTLARTIAENHSGSAVIHGTDLTATPSQAAFVDGVGGSVLELNAGHKYAAGHPVVQIFPAIFTEAVGRDSDGERFLTAFIASYEICTRAARASRPLKDEYLPHGVWGTVGATAGIGRLRGFDTETMLRAMQVGASFAQHTRFEATGEGATGVRNGSVGMSNLAAIVAADLAEKTDERALFMTEEHGRAVYLYRGVGNHAVRTNSRIGTYRHLHTIAGGKAMLAHMADPRIEAILNRWGLPRQTENTITEREELFDRLAEIRERGVAFNDEETIEGLRAVAVPILGPDDTVYGALSVSGPSHRIRGEWFEDEIPNLLLGTANELELNLEYM
jgi:DNA-binding IclR family transcriptional regulator